MDDLNERMLSRFHNLYKELSEYIMMCGAANYAHVNVKLLGGAIRDYFEDIERLKAFEGMKRANEAKIYAYETFWLLRRKPIQLITSYDIPETGLCLNEFICASMMVSRMFTEAGKAISNMDSKRMDFINLLFYNFKYRLYTQKSLELMAEAFFLGCTGSS